MVDVINIIRAQAARSVEAELNAEAITTLGGERGKEPEREKELVRRCLIM